MPMAGPCICEGPRGIGVWAVTSLNRVVMERRSRKMLKALHPETLDAAEISGHSWRGFGFRSHLTLRYPAHDICKGAFADETGTPMQFDIILANQVWEHLDRPYAATRNVMLMLRPGGMFWLASPFFVPFHGNPVDCSRWSARGLTNLLIESGFAPGRIQAGQWGNLAPARRNLEKPWPPVYRNDVDDLANDRDFPIMAWALARLP